MRVRLLNDGGFGNMDGVLFPTDVRGTHTSCIGNDGYCEVTGDELLKAGASYPAQWDRSYKYVFIVGTECEVLFE